MAVFEPAYLKTNGTEGGYANNPADAGGETYKGIARKFHPKWPGWKQIDDLKKSTTAQPPYGTASYRSWVRYIDKALAQIVSLQQQALAFYRAGFWTANRLGELTDQAVAEWTYDHAVNGGARGIMWIQLAARVDPDGDLGSASIVAINATDPTELLNRAEDIAGAYRLDRAHVKPSQIQFLTSWLTRDGQPETIIAQVRMAAKDGSLDDAEIVKLKSAMETTA